MIQKKVIYFVLAILIFSCKEKKGDANFPKSVEIVEDLPEKENFWIFVLAGQSNMAGRGFVEPSDTIPNSRILSITKDNQWKIAKEPLNFNEPDLTGLDCGVSFARALLDSIPKNVTIGLVHTAIGGSAVEQWVGDSIHKIKLLSNFKNTVDFAKQYGVVKGILWHQGESNANPELIKDYKKNVNQLFATFRSHIENRSLPIIMGELGAFERPGNEGQYRDSINNIINNYTNNEHYTSIIKTGDLEHKGDSLHFDSKAQRTMGKRYAKVYLNMMNTGLVLDSKYNQIQDIVSFAECKSPSGKYTTEVESFSNGKTTFKQIPEGSNSPFSAVVTHDNYAYAVNNTGEITDSLPDQSREMLRSHEFHKMHVNPQHFFNNIAYKSTGNDLELFTANDRLSNPVNIFYNRKKKLIEKVEMLNTLDTTQVIEVINKSWVDSDYGKLVKEVEIIQAAKDTFYFNYKRLKINDKNILSN